MKWIYIILLIGLLCFSAYGFVATFEPNDRYTQILFWGIYSTTFIGSIAGIVLLLRSHLKN